MRWIILMGWILFPLALAIASCDRYDRQVSPEGAMTTSPVKISEHMNGEAPPKSAEYAVGIPECDDYLDKYERCIMKKVPEEERLPFRQDFEKKVIDLKKAADEQPRPGVAQSCQTARKIMQEATKRYACDWDSKVSQ